MENRFKESLLDKNTFTVTWELIPGRGAREKSQEEIIMAAEQAAKGGKIQALTLTDNPGGNPAILADSLATEVLKKGIEPLVHFTCKDRNRNQIESQLYALDRAGIRNLLVMTGDYPVTGYAGRPRPVYDLDPIHVLDLISQMNRGLEYQGMKGTIKHKPSDFFAGAAVSPFKATEAEQMVQYFKLKKKVKAGAQFIITQLGYDARKFHEVIQFVRQQGWDIPVIGNIYILPLATARVMNQNKIPGCVVTDKLVAQLEKEAQAPDKGRQARLDRAAKMYAFMKGMGYAGVHIGGHGVKYEDVEYIIERGEEWSKNWMDFIHEFDFPIPGGFYYYEKDPKTGLNTPNPVDRKNRPLDADVEFVYYFSKVMHNLMLEPGTPLWKPMQAIARAVDGTSLEKTYHKLEHLIKVCLFDCKDCGDCALFDVGYVCPMSQCPKNQRNGACGGSYMGWCEVYPNKKKCVYVRAYARLKSSGKEDALDSYIVPPPNWDLYQTSSWLNFYLGRDHTAKRLGVEPYKKKKKEK